MPTPHDVANSRSAKRLAGLRLLITGASRGIGREIALRAGEEGARVAVNYLRSVADAAAVVEAIERAGGSAFAVQADVADAAAATRLVDTVVATFGGLDAVVCNAGFAKRQPFLDITPEDWDAAQAVNLRGVFLVSQAAARHMVEAGGGVIVHVSSSTVHRPTLNTADYTAAKAGVEALTRAMAVELGPHGIRVNAVAPGLTNTDMNREALKDPGFRSARLERIPLRQIGEPGDVAGAVIFLLSDDARYVTGATIRVDAGLSIG